MGKGLMYETPSRVTGWFLRIERSISYSTVVLVEVRLQGLYVLPCDGASHTQSISEPFFRFLLSHSPCIKCIKHHFRELVLGVRTSLQLLRPPVVRFLRGHPLCGPCVRQRGGLAPYSMASPMPEPWIEKVASPSARHGES